MDKVKCIIGCKWDRGIVLGGYPFEILCMEKKRRHMWVYGFKCVLADQRMEGREHMFLPAWHHLFTVKYHPRSFQWGYQPRYVLHAGRMEK